MAHPMAVLVGDCATNVTPLHRGEWRAQLTLAPDAIDVLLSVGASGVKRRWARAARQRQESGPNARITIQRVLRLPPIALEYRGVSTVVQAAELMLKTGHTLVTLPRAMLRTPLGVWNGISFRHVASVAADPACWPAQGAALATMAASAPPCTVCSALSADADTALCAAHRFAYCPVAPHDE